MKIGLIAYNTDNSLGTGSERYAYRVREGLEERGHEIVPIESQRNLDTLERTIYSMWDVRKQIRKFEDEVDVFHATIPQYAIHAGVTDTPFITTWHDIIQLVTKRSGNSWRGRAFAKFFYRRATASDHFVAISSQTRDMIQSYYGIPDEKITVIAHGIDEKFNPGQRDQETDEKFTFGYLGAMNERKRVDYLIESYRIFDQKFDADGTELVIRGKKDFKYEELKKQAEEAGLTEKIRFKGFVPEDKIVQAYRDMDAFVFASEREGWGYPVTEAMACGTPVIIRDGCIPREVKDPAAKASNPEEMANRMEKMRGDISYRERISNRQIKRAENYDWESNIRKLEALFEEKADL